MIVVLYKGMKTKTSIRKDNTNQAGCTDFKTVSPFTSYKGKSIMKNLKSVFTGIIISVVSISTHAMTRDDSLDEPVSLSQVNMSGPRFGITGVIAGDQFANELHNHGVENLYTQFGWHFEFLVRPVEDPVAPALVFEAVPLLGALEAGTIIPSVSLLVGIRFSNGVEFGMGPNISITPNALYSSMVLAGGVNFNYHGVKIPATIAVVKGKGGYCISTLVGYGIIKSKKRIEPVASY